MKTRQFWYPLPERLIAQHPAEKRGTEKMMVLHRATGVVEHRHIADIVEYITANDLLVVNDTKVFPARLIGEWPDTHGAIELLMVNAAPMDADDERPSMTAGTDSLRWNCIIGSGRKCREGQVASFGPAGELKATLVKPLSGIGMWQVEFSCDRPLMDLLDEFGRTPVPPYVKRVAVTLHVGPGTFRPVKAENIEDHHMDFEAFTVPPETAEAINECKARGGRVFCVGSTTVRTLETVAAAVDGQNGTVRTLETVAAAVDGQNGRVVEAGSGASDIFIYPPYRFRVCDCMLTNFHLPQSTLLMMISALAGRERVLCSYALAVRNNYMFFSYGDCMLIV